MRAARSADVGSVFTFVQPFQSCRRYSGGLLLSRAQLPVHAASSCDSTGLPRDCPFKSWCAGRCERRKKRAGAAAATTASRGTPPGYINRKSKRNLSGHAFLDEFLEIAPTADRNDKAARSASWGRCS